MPIDDSGIPRVTYCDPRSPPSGITEAQAKEQYGDDKVQAYEYNLGGNGKSQILKTAGIVKVVRQKDGPVVGVHMVGARMGEQVGEASLIVNWEAFPDEVAAVHPRPPDPERVARRGPSRAGRQAPAHARLTRARA